MTRSDPAFPRPIGSYRTLDGVEYSPGQRGMTLLDYFAAHAPAEPQPWFTPATEPKPTPPSEALELLPATMDVGGRNFLTNIAQNWRRDPCFDLSDYVLTGDRAERVDLVNTHRAALVMYEERWRLYWDEANEWDAAYLRAKFAQWPYAWANAVLAERLKAHA